MAAVSLINVLRADTEFSDDQALLVGGGVTVGVIAIITLANLRKPEISRQKRHRP